MAFSLPPPIFTVYNNHLPILLQVPSPFGLGCLVSIGSSEGNAARVVEFHGDRRSSRGLGGSRKGASRNATAGGHLADPGEGRHGSRGGSHWEDLVERSSIESD